MKNSGRKNLEEDYYEVNEGELTTLNYFTPQGYKHQNVTRCCYFNLFTQDKLLRRHEQQEYDEYRCDQNIVFRSLLQTFSC